MIHVLEGPNCVGKSTLAKRLSDWSGQYVYSDPGRHGFVYDWLGEFSERDWLVQGAQHSIDVASLSGTFDFIVDRWVLSNIVYNGLRGVPTPPDFVRQIASLASAKVLLLLAPVETIVERSAARALSPGRVREQIEAFCMAANVYKGCGHLVEVDCSGSEEEVFDAVRSHW